MLIKTSIQITYQISPWLCDRSLLSVPREPKLANIYLIWTLSEKRVTAPGDRIVLRVFGRSEWISCWFSVCYDELSKVRRLIYSNTWLLLLLSWLASFSQILGDSSSVLVLYQFRPIIPKSLSHCPRCEPHVSPWFSHHCNHCEHSTAVLKFKGFCLNIRFYWKSLWGRWLSWAGRMGRWVLVLFGYQQF